MKIKEKDRIILLEIDNEKKNYENKIKKLREEITIEYNELKYLTNIK